MDNIEIFSEEATNLEILAEECAEIIQIKSKIMRFGLDDFHEKNEMTNCKKLNQEVGHLLAMIEILIHTKVLNEKELMAGKYHKFEKLEKWYGKLDYLDF